jgi:hypothetical protein
MPWGKTERNDIMSNNTTREEMLAALMASRVPAADWLAGLEKSVAEAEPPRLDGRPELVLPGDGKSLSEFASELGEKLKVHRVYKRDGIALYVTDGNKLEPMRSSSFVTWVEQYVRIMKWAGTGKERRLESASMTEAAAGLILDSVQFLRHLNPIRRVNLVRQPVIRKHGKLELLPIGYDAESQTVTVGEIDFDEGMSLDDALLLLDELQREFAWPRSEPMRSRSIALSAQLAVFGDMMLDPAHQRPVWIYGANREGAGKTLLIRLAVCPTFGPAVIGPPPDPSRSDALTKLLASAALAGSPYLIFDNWGKGHVIGNPSLEAFITSSTYSDRVLGVSKMFTVEKQCLVFISGNGARVSPDMRRRSLVVDLEVVEARSEDREIKKPMGEPEILKARPQILAALWAIIRDWDAKGRPEGSFRHSSFSIWSKMFGGMIEAIGLPNPCETGKLDLDDTLRDMQKLVVEALEASFDQHVGKTFTSAELLDFSRERGYFEWILSEEPPDREETKRQERGKFAKICDRFDGSKFGEIEFVSGPDVRDPETRTRKKTWIIRRCA